MKGLLIKDLYMAKKHSLLLIIISLLFFGISFFGKSIYFSYYPIAIISILPMNILAYDDYYRWNKNEVVLPVSRAQAVLEKYVLLFILILPAIIISNIVFFFVFHFGLREIISLISLMLFAGVMVPSVVFPICFKIGYTRAKAFIGIMIPIIMAAIVLINVGNLSGEMMIIGKFTPQQNAYLFAVAAIVLLGVSMLLSINFYKKREF
ncbi:MAG: ABC-2 transporter permease [Eubacterium sp.]|nr:ABC-2 transporter permease [Eubacterium sp.]